MNNFDLDISTYTLTELENLLNLNAPYTVDGINTKRNDLKNKITNMQSIDTLKREKILMFLDNIHQKVFDNLMNQNVIQNTFKNTVYDKNINFDTNKGKLVDSNNYPPGYLNPINIKTIKKAINIDSLFRTDYYTSKSSNYTINLPERINKIVSMQVSSIQLPLTYYAISPALDNDSFEIELYDTSGNLIPNTITTIKLPAGNYESQFSKSLHAADIETTINYQLQNSGNSGYPDISNSIGFIVDKISGRSVFALQSTKPANVSKFKVNFNTGKNNTPIAFKLGWLLGFRAAEYIGESIASEGICYITGPKYLFLAINDYQNSAHNYFTATYNESILAPNIIGRINIGCIAESQTIYKSGQDDDFGYPLNRTREYFGPTDIHRLTISLYDEYGRIIDLNNMDWSLVLTFECLYD